MDFNSLGLRPALVQAVEDLGFHSPLPIQEKAIPTLLSGERDFVGLAHTGTGKTGAFGLPLIQRIDLTLPRPQGLVMCPTRELCLQITGDLKRFARHVKGIKIVAVYGGAGISQQIRLLQQGGQIIVATPGRLLDLIDRKAADLSQVSCTVLDEADEMLSMGFQEDIDRILGQVPGPGRIWLFSATMRAGVGAVVRNYLSDPVEVTEGGQGRGPENIEHICYMIREKHRYEALKRIVDFNPAMYGLAFCRTRRETQSVAEALIQDGHQAEALHGDLSQAQREYVMRKFRQGNIRILVATDIAARGLDVDDITHVIHYNLPDEAEIYTHRSGRTARVGKSGASIVLADSREAGRVRELEKAVDIRFRFAKIPKGRAICEKQLFGLVEKIVDTEVRQEEIAEYLPAVYDALGGFDKEELIARFVSAEFNRFLESYRHSGDIHVQGRSTPPRAFRPSKRKDPLKGKNTQRFFISVGRLDKVNEKGMVRLICDHSGIRPGMIGDIALKREYSFFEVDRGAAGKVGNSFHNVLIGGRPVQVRKVLKNGRQARG